MPLPIELLRDFFHRPECQLAVGPLRNGVEIRIRFPDGQLIALKKSKTSLEVIEGDPSAPDLTIVMATNSLTELMSIEAEDVGDVGVGILKLMAHSDPQIRITAKVHVGIFGFLRNGYLGILPLGGMKVTQFLASKGVSGLGKIKSAIDSLRS